MTNSRPKRPLDKAAVQAANAATWKKYPELGGRQLTLKPEDYKYRKAWMDAYQEALGKPKEPVADKKPVKDPVAKCPGDKCCSGIGLSSEKNVKEFVDDFKKLQKDWPELEPAEREQKLEEIANKQLKKSGLPPVGVKPEDLEPGNGGNLDFENWQLALNENMLNADALSDAEAQSLANTVYHESRHAEQWYLMAQRRAMNGQSARKIRRRMSIPGKIARSAVKDPLKKGTVQARCAQEMHDSVYGKNAAARNKTLTDLMDELKNTNEAFAEQKKVNENPASTEEQKEKAAEDANAARTKFTSAHQKYLALPEEADAFETGDKVDENW